jgi:hypothetical protein
VLGGKEEGCARTEEELREATEPELEWPAFVDGDSSFLLSVEQAFARQFTQLDTKLGTEAIRE